jgi:hypothetical protein
MHARNCHEASHRVSRGCIIALLRLICAERLRLNLFLGMGRSLADLCFQVLVLSMLVAHSQV